MGRSAASIIGVLAVLVAWSGRLSPRASAAAGEVSTLAGVFDRPTGVAVDASDTVYVAEYQGNRISKISGVTVSLLAGSATGVSGLSDATGGAAR